MPMKIPGTIALSELDRLRLESSYDESLRKKLRTDPASVLSSRGIQVPSGVTINIVEDSVGVHNLTLPPFVGDDSSRQALKAAAGANMTWECTTCTPTSPICAGSLASLTCITKNC